jgi:cytochrome c-type biogenesis protein CcmH
MIQFWICAVLLVGAALAFLVTPLLRKRAAAGGAAARAEANLVLFRDQLTELDADLAAGTISREQWESARGDLQRGLLEDVEAAPVAATAAGGRSRAAAIAVVLAVPLVSVSLYLLLGNQQALDPAVLASAQQGAPHQLSKEQIESMVARLAKRLESSDDGEGWLMLARTYNALGRFGEAAAAFAKAESKFPQDAQLLADYADTLAMAQGQRLAGKPEALIKRALELDANNLKALALAGTVAFEQRDYGKAIDLWGRMLPLLPEGSEMGDSIRGNIKEAQDKLAQSGGPRIAAAAPGKAASKSGSVSGTVKLASALAARAAPDDTVFVLARPAQGSRMPLAATRVRVKDLPLTFSFDDSMAMNPSSKISDFPEVVVAARISKSGNVMPQPGDFEGVSRPARPGASGIKVDIATEIK